MRCDYRVLPKQYQPLGFLKANRPHAIGPLVFDGNCVHAFNIHMWEQRDKCKIFPYLTTVADIRRIKIMNFRKMLIQELARQNRSAYWLGSQTGTPAMSRIYEYINGTRDMCGENIARCFQALGVKLKVQR